MNPNITFFIEDAAVTGRQTEQAVANWNSGMFGGASNSPGIGINIGGGSLEPERLSNWTALDQFGDARQSQIGQHIGGEGWVDRSSVDWPSSGGTEGTLPDATIRNTPAANLPTYAEKLAGTKLDGELSLPANGAWLEDIATGWTDGDPTP